MASVYDFTLFGTLLPVIAEDFGWSVAESTAINTYATIGVFLVALAVGTIIDKMGRKKALIVLMLGGAVLTETTFEWKGIGYELTQYLKARDFLAVQGIVTAIAVVVCVASVVIDAIIAIVDPRVRF